MIAHVEQDEELVLQPDTEETGKAAGEIVAQAEPCPVLPDAGFLQELHDLELMAAVER